MQSAADIDPLIGRDADLTFIDARLAEARLISLTGPGGSGKTRLAEATANRRRDRGLEAWFVDASSITDPQLIPATIAATLRIESDGQAGPLEEVQAALRDREVLLAIDNVEQINGAGPFVGELLRSLPELRVVVTSRTRLGVRGETEVAVQPLEVPDNSSVAALEASPAGRLFLARARAAGQLRTLDDATAAAIVELIRRLDGLPLAVELAAARTRVLSPGEILARLDRHGIAALGPTGSDPHRSLAGIIDWSRGLLGEAEARLLDAVSICAGFDVALAEALVPDVDAVAAIDALLTVGLVQRAGTIGNETRFRLLETVRAVVAPGLPPDAVPELRDRHARAIADLVAGQVARGPAAVADVVERLDAEADNIRLALDRLDEADPARGLELWDQLFYPFWAVRARLREGIARLERTAALVREPTAALARALVRYGMNQGWVGEEAASKAASLRALDVARTVGDRQSEIESLVTLSAIAVNQGDVELAKTVDDGLRSIDDGDEPPDVRMRLAEGRHHVAAAIHGQASDEARDALLEAAALADEVDQPRTGAALWGNLAIAYIHRREFAAAVDASELAIALARRMQSPLLPWALGARAMALAESHSTGGAVEALAEMIEETLARDMAVQTVDTLLASMSVALAAGQPLTAARAWGAASALERAGAADIPPDDRLLAERTLARVRQRAREIDVELAIRDGEKVEPLAFLTGLPATLADRATASAAAGSRLRHGDLTRREIEILRLLAAGRSDGDIAAELFISPKTASVHVSNVKAKLGVESRLEAALKAREMGFGDT